MSDKPIAFVPIIAEDADTSPNYPAGADPWSGTPRIQEPSAGEYAAGDAPNPSWFSSQALNGLGYRWGRALNAVMDLPTFSVRARNSLQDNGLSYAGGTVYNNNTHTTEGDPPMLMAGDDGWLYAQAKLTIRRTRLGQGLGNAGSADTAEWVAGASCGLTNNSGDVGTSDGAARPPIMAADRATGLLVAFARGGDMTASTDRGDTWSSTNVVDPALTTALGGAASPVTAAVCWNGLVLVAYKVGIGPYGTKIYAASQSDLTTWEAVGTYSNNTADPSVSRIVIGNNSVLFLGRVGTRVVKVTGTLGSWTLTAIQFATHNTGKTQWRGAWNEAIGMFVIGNAQGDIWGSQDGSSWAQIEFGASGNCRVRDIAPHGRGFMISNSVAEWAVDFFAQAADQTWEFRRVLSAYLGNTGPACAFHLHNVHGRWVAARHYEPPADTGFDRLEWYEGGVSPWDRNSFVGV